MSTGADSERSDIEAVSTDNARWRFGDVLLDEATRELSVAGVKVEIRRKPLDLLMFLVRNPGEVLTKDELFEAVWPGRIVSETALTNAVGLLRTALGDQDQQMIKMVYGYGYRFVAEVRRDDPPAEAPTLASFDFAPGQPVPHRGEWRFEQVLGGGSYGEVWLAEQPATREKRVFKFARDGSALASLKREITLFRLMREGLGERADRVRLLDWNLEQPPYFIGQEWCTGGSLPQWADSQGGIGKVALNTRLELVAQAAEALAAAHSVGVLHKDLKPSNLLVALDKNGQPQIKLADFGSARLLSRGTLSSMNITQLGFTQTLVENMATEGGSTPLYLAPEVIAGQPPTIQSDIYALGVILYQLAVGNLRQPLAPGWERGIDDELLREDIAAAAAGDPQQRLADAGQLAQRLRSLDARRIERQQERSEAERAAAAQRLLDRARARRGLLQALAATLVIGLAATSYLLWRSTIASQQALAEAARANAVTNFLTDDLLSAGNPEISGRRNVTVREVLDAAQPRLAERFKDQPRIEATLQRVLGTAYAALGEREPAERLLSSAEQGLAREIGPAAAETQIARMHLRDSYLNFFDGDNAEATLNRALEAENAAGRPNLDVALEAEAQRDLLACWAKFPSLYVARCDDAADHGYKLALEKLGPDSRATLGAELDAGDSRLKTGRFAEALPLIREAHEGMKKHHPDNRFAVVLSGFLLNQALIGSDKEEEALPSIERFIKESAEVYGPGSRFHLIARRWHARALRQRGDAAAALAELDEVRAIWLRQEAGIPSDYAWIESERARSLMMLKRPLDAETALAAGLAKVAKGEQPSGYWTLTLREQLADVRRAQNDHAAAERLLRQNLDEARKLMTQGEWLLGWDAYRLGDLLAADGRIADAEPLLKEALGILEASLGAEEPRTRLARERLAALTTGKS